MTQREAQDECASRFPEGIVNIKGVYSADGSGVYLDDDGGRWEVEWSQYGIECFRKQRN